MSEDQTGDKLLDNLRFQLGLFVKESCRSNCEPCQKARSKCSKMLPLLKQLAELSHSTGDQAELQTELQQLKDELKRATANAAVPADARSEIDRLKQALFRANQKLEAPQPSPPAAETPFLKKQLQETHVKMSEMAAEIAALRAGNTLARSEATRSEHADRELAELRAQVRSLHEELQRCTGEKAMLEEKHRQLADALSSEVFSALGHETSAVPSSPVELLRAQAKQLNSWGVAGGASQMSAALEATISELVEQFEQAQKANDTRVARMAEELAEAQRSGGGTLEQMQGLEAEVQVLENRLQIASAAGMAEAAVRERNLQQQFETRLEELGARYQESNSCVEKLKQERGEVAAVLYQVSQEGQREWTSLVQLAQHVRGVLEQEVAARHSAEEQVRGVSTQNSSMADALRSMGQLNVQLEGELETLLREFSRVAGACNSNFLQPLEQQSRVLRHQLDKVQAELEAQINSHKRDSAENHQRLSELLASPTGPGADQLVTAIEAIMSPSKPDASVRASAERIVKIMQDRGDLYSESNKDQRVRTELLLAMSMLDSLIKHVHQEHQAQVAKLSAPSGEKALPLPSTADQLQTLMPSSHGT